MVVHLLSAVTFNCNVGHSLALYFFFVLGWFCSLSFSSFSSYRRGFRQLGVFRPGLWVRVSDFYGVGLVLVGF